MIYRDSASREEENPETEEVATRENKEKGSVTMVMPLLIYVLQWHGYLICNSNKWYTNLNERKDKDREEEHLHKLKLKNIYI